MKKIDLLNLKGEKINDIKLNEETYGITPNDKVLYDAIILTQASLRQGTHSTKNRSEVRGGGRKPWRQKGTGHARQGSIRSVQWVGGGRYGTPVPRDYSKKQNRKERRLALRSALTHKAQDNEIMVIEELVFTTPKTKEMVSLLNTLKLSDKKVLIVMDNESYEENVILSARNLQNIALIYADEVNVLDLVNSDMMLVTEKALSQIEEVLR